MQLLLFVVLAVAAAPRHLEAQDMDLPVATQWSLLDRILAYDRGFASRVHDGVVVGILYQGGYRPGRFAHDEVVSAAKALEGRVVGGQRFRLVSIEAPSGRKLLERLREEEVDLLYVAPLRAYDIGEVARVAAELGLPTFTGVRQYVGDGIGVGVGQRGGRPEILINLQAARDQGMDLDAQFLRLVTVITSDRQ